MPQPQRSPDETRERIFRAAERTFRARGFEGAGVDTVARAAGTTSGALYAHFPGKAALFRAVVRNGLERLLRRIRRMQAEAGEGWLPAFTHWYVSAAHRGDIEGGCLLPGLAADVARADAETRVVWDEGMAAAQAAMLAAPPLAGRPGADQLAWQILSLLAGATALARASGEAGAGAIADAAEAAIRRLLETPPGPAG
jgi:AcrR family transcriptional regulator